MVKSISAEVGTSLEAADVEAWLDQERGTSDKVRVAAEIHWIRDSNTCPHHIITKAEKKWNTVLRHCIMTPLWRVSDCGHTTQISTLPCHKGHANGTCAAPLTMQVPPNCATWAPKSPTS